MSTTNIFVITLKFSVHINIDKYMIIMNNIHLCIETQSHKMTNNLKIESNSKNRLHLDNFLHLGLSSHEFA